MTVVNDVLTDGYHPVQCSTLTGNGVGFPTQLCEKSVADLYPAM